MSNKHMENHEESVANAEFQMLLGIPKAGESGENYQARRLRSYGNTHDAVTQSLPIINESTEIEDALNRSTISEHEEEFTGEPSGKKAVVSMAVGTLISRILGFVKMALTLYVLGSSTDISDSFAFANQVPNLLYILIGGGALNSILVPQIIKASQARDHGVAYINKLITLVVLISGTITLMLLAASPLIVHFFGADWSPTRQSLTLVFLLWSLPQIFFYVLYTVFGQVLNARSIFQPYMWAPIINNVIAIAGLFVFLYAFGEVANDANAINDWTPAKTFVFLGSTTLGVIAQALVLIRPIFKTGYRLSPSFGWRGMGFRETGRVAIWAILLVILNQLSYLVIFWVEVNAGNLRHTFGGDPSSVAGNATYDSASMLITFPHSIVAVSIATLIFTRMSVAANNNNIEELKYQLSYAQRSIAVLTFFAFAVFVVLAGQIGMAVGGENKVAGRTMGFVILSLCGNIPLLSMNFVFQRVFYSLSDSKTPFIIQIPVSIAVSGLALAALLLPPQWIVIGLGLNGLFTLAFSVALDVYFIRKRIGDINGWQIARSFARIGIATLISMVVGALTLWIMGGFNFNGFPWIGRFEALVTCFPVVMVMGISYFIGLRVLKVPELNELLGAVANKLPARLAKFIQ
ncbi:MAG: lipid II flippase MurJ [Micrococcaceae bacterium]